MLNRLLSVLAISGLFNLPAEAETLKVLNWNVKVGSVEEIAKRRNGISAVSEGQIPDVVILQEINSFASAQLIAKFMGMDNPYIAVSDFGDDHKIVFFGFETAVISRVPIISVHEFQPRDSNGTPNPNGPIQVSPDGEISISVNENVTPLEIPTDIITNVDDAKQRISRGLLRVELENGLVIYPVHLKSNLPRICGELRDLGEGLSAAKFFEKAIPEAEERAREVILSIERLARTKVNGEQNPKPSIGSKRTQEMLPAFTEAHRRTAASRENTAAALMKLVAQDFKNNNVKAVIVAGDFNTPLEEASKTGTDLIDDCMPQPLSCTLKEVPDTCGTEDGYDDTHYILQSGIVEGAQLTPLLNIKESTHIGSGFALSPIDNIYVSSGINIVREAKLVKGSGEIAFGSDHFPIEVHISLD